MYPRVVVIIGYVMYRGIPEYFWSYSDGYPAISELFCSYSDRYPGISELFWSYARVGRYPGRYPRVYALPGIYSTLKLSYYSVCRFLVVTVILVYRVPSSWEMCSSACGVSWLCRRKSGEISAIAAFSAFFLLLYHLLFVCV